MLPKHTQGRTPEQGPDSSETPDEVLMVRFCQGDARAFDLLFERHGAPLRGFFRRMTRSEAAADDLLQQTFLHLVRARGRYDPRERFAPWLYAIARNAARDYLRLARHRVEGGAEPEVLAAVPADPREPGADPGELKALQEALEQLPENYREAVVLHQLEGLSFQEIARILGSTPGAVKVRAHRGYQKLRELLASLRGKP